MESAKVHHGTAEIAESTSENAAECQMTGETSQVSAIEATQGDVSEHCITSNTRHATGHVGADQCTGEQPESEINVSFHPLENVQQIRQTFEMSALMPTWASKL